MLSSVHPRRFMTSGFADRNGPKLWDSLPDKIISIKKGYGKFKRELKTRLFSVLINPFEFTVYSYI